MTADNEAAGSSKIPPAPLGLAGRVLSTVAGCMILAMMGVTTADVVARYVFNRPLWGAFEVTEILMGLVIFAGLPLATAAREHVVVNFLEGALSARVLALQAVATDLVCAATCALLAWRILVRADQLTAAREVTMQLGVPRGAIAYAMAGLASLGALTFLWAAATAWRGARRRA